MCAVCVGGCVTTVWHNEIASLPSTCLQYHFLKYRNGMCFTCAIVATTLAKAVQQYVIQCMGILSL